MKGIDGGYKLSELLFGRGGSADAIVNVAAVELRFWAVVLAKKLMFDKTYKKIGVAGSACSCPAELISSYLDKIMAPIVKTLPSYIKDSQHALEIFRDFSFLDQNKLIFTMDITSLYTVIPNDEGLRALKHFFDQRTVKEPSSETLLRLAELVLTFNCFSFGGNYYKQTNGVAMGTKMGPSYANLFVGFIEHQFFSQYHGSEGPINWCRCHHCLQHFTHFFFIQCMLVKQVLQR